MVSVACVRYLPVSADLGHGDFQRAVESGWGAGSRGHTGKSGREVWAKWARPTCGWLGLEQHGCGQCRSTDTQVSFNEYQYCF